MSLWHPLALLIGGVLAGIVAIVSYHLRLLTKGGALAAFFIGSLVFALGRVAFGLPMVFFFASSSLLSKVGHERKSKLLSRVAKSSQRDAAQVMANGLLPTLLLIFWSYSQNVTFCFQYVAALACAMSDTWATELGVLSRRAPRSIVGFRRLQTGSSGGVTFVGTTAALVGAALLVAIGLFSLTMEVAINIQSKHLIVVIVAAFLGQVGDSVLGAVWQRKYLCRECGCITENENHCGQAGADRVAGLAWMSNDTVNLLAISTAIVSCWTGLYLIGESS